MVGQSKSEVRRDLLRLREAQKVAVRSERSERIQARFLDLHQVRSGCRLALYSPVRGEVETRLIFDQARLDGKQLAFPLALRAESRLEFFVVDDLRDLVPGAFGILEPRPTNETRLHPSDIDVVAVPGVGFDRNGCRLGYGGGYYDRLLGMVSTRPRSVVGLAFDIQILDALPQERDDARMDCVVTESATFPAFLRREAAVPRPRPAFEEV